ncbi:MAG: hypothetical protein GX557_14455, partial [Chloroflexi bacterium]|nr:hypothetical protein [Chloroflexota bacterium]
MTRPTDVEPIGAALYLIPVQTRVPLKFGKEVLHSAVCARVCVRVRDHAGRSAVGWGETPLSAQWVWPSTLAESERRAELQGFCQRLARAWADLGVSGHPVEIGHTLQRDLLPGLLKQANEERAVAAGGEVEGMPWLAALVCCSPFDIALHDAYGALHGRPVYDLYGGEWLGTDLARFLTPADGADVGFAGRYPADYLVFPRAQSLPAWHLVGGVDALGVEDLTGSEPQDGYPVLLPDWIARDGLFCLKVKLRGNDAGWDYARLVRTGQIGVAQGVQWLTADFNCTVTDPGYVNEILDRLAREQPRLYGMLLYVEQPFPYDL